MLRYHLEACAMKRILCGVACALLAGARALGGEEPAALSDADLASLHQLIKRQPGESRWMEIDWYPSIWEARRKAAAEGKPLFLMAGSGGAPAAGC
jgi:hypothetical protein